MEFSVLGSWLPLLRQELEQPYMQSLVRQVDDARRAGPVYPPEEAQFRAFSLTPPERVRVVILGQDPYHEAGQANGLAFSVQRGVPLPPSLRNLFRELQDDLGCAPPPDGDLSGWARQGVLLLNTVLTVSAGQANSHRGFGWQRFTAAVIDALRPLPQPIVFVLWGSQARGFAGAAGSPHPRLVLEAPHPSPLSAYRGFFGSRPFSQINAFLTSHGEAAIDFSRRADC